MKVEKVMSDNAPIVLFVYNRLNETKQTLEALKKNVLAAESELYIYSDASKSVSGKVKVDAVREYIRTIGGFKTVCIVERENNFGLAKSVIQGVSEIVKQHGKVIVLEDDLVTTKNFLVYMNKALSFYENNEKIFSITGYAPPMRIPASYPYDTFLNYRAHSWGWATWYDRWNQVEWTIEDYNGFLKNTTARKKFLRGGEDMLRILRKQMGGYIDSWAIRWCYHQAKHDLLTVNPVVSKVKNIGFSKEATHTKTRAYVDEVDATESLEFAFTPGGNVDADLLRQSRRYYSNLYKVKMKLKHYARVLVGRKER